MRPLFVINLQGRKVKILLVEDDYMLGTAISLHIQSNGDILKFIQNGEDAFEYISTQSFDLLILDINLPGINGLSLLEKLQEHKIQIPTIFISALLDIEDISRAYNLGCCDYLKKPFHLKELTLRIDKIVQTNKISFYHKRLSKSYSFDSENMTLLFNNEPQILPKRQLQIIELLAQNRGIIVTYDMFRDYVWCDDMIDNATIRAELNRIKKVLKEKIIINIRTIGYMIEKP
jgi:DNA-binding response OmpR family regulator